jgi:uncharacterized coiled-coil DUF342 family protein
MSDVNLDVITLEAHNTAMLEVRTRLQRAEAALMSVQQQLTTAEALNNKMRATAQELSKRADASRAKAGSMLVELATFMRKSEQLRAEIQQAHANLVKMYSG